MPLPREGQRLAGRQLGGKTTTATTSDDHLEMLRWAGRGVALADAPAEVRLAADAGAPLRLPLAETAFPALRREPRERLMALVALVSRLTHADQRVSLFEFGAPADFAAPLDAGTSFVLLLLEVLVVLDEGHALVALKVAHRHLAVELAVGGQLRVTRGDRRLDPTTALNGARPAAAYAAVVLLSVLILAMGLFPESVIRHAEHATAGFWSGALQ